MGIIDMKKFEIQKPAICSSHDSVAFRYTFANFSIADITAKLMTIKSFMAVFRKPQSCSNVIENRSLHSKS